MTQRSNKKLARPKDVFLSLWRDSKYNMNKNQITIGIHNKKTNQICEKSFKNFDIDDMSKNDEIFWFKLNGEYLWNRKERLDLLFGSGNTNKNDHMKFIKKYTHKSNHTKKNQKKNNRYTFTDKIEQKDDDDSSIDIKKDESPDSNTKFSNNINYNNNNNNNSIQKYRYLLVLDFEATCDKKYNPKPQEIIEWPTMAIDTQTNKVVSKFHYYIKPAYNPKLTQFCVDLTGITQDTIETRGKTIEFVLESWNKWCQVNGFNETNSIIITCGNWDLQTCWQTQKKYIKSNRTNGTCLNRNKFINIKNVYRHYLKEKAKGMMYMLARLDIQHVGRHHSGIDDVRNICEIVLWFLRKNVVFHEHLGL